MLLGYAAKGLPRNEPQKTPLLEAGYYFHKSTLILVTLSVVVALAAKGTCLHFGGVALEVSSGIRFHAAPHDVIILFGPYFDARALPTGLQVTIIYISTISHRCYLLYMNLKVFFNVTIPGFSVKRGENQ